MCVHVAGIDQKMATQASELLNIPRAFTDSEIKDAEIDWDYFSRISNKAEEIREKLKAQEQNDLTTGVQDLLNAFSNLQNELSRQEEKYNNLLPKVTEANDTMAKALLISDNCRKTINQLKKSLEDAWKESDAALLREEKVQADVQELQEKLRRLEGKVLSGRRKDDTHEDLGTLTSKRQTILKERDRLQAEVEDLNGRLQIQRSYAETLERKRADAETENKALVEKLDTNEILKAKIERKVLDITLKEQKLKESNEALYKKLDSLQNLVDESENRIEEKESEIQSIKLQNEKLKLESAACTKKVSKINTENHALIQEKVRLGEQLRQVRGQVQIKEDEIHSIKKKLGQVTSQYDSLASRLMAANYKKNDVVQDLIKTKTQLTSLEKDRLTSAKKLNDLQKDKNIAVRERDLQRSNLTKLRNTTNELSHIVFLRDQEIERLKDDITKHLATINKQTSEIAFAEKERDENAYEAQTLSDTVKELQNMIQAQEEHIEDLNRDMSDKTAKFAHVQKLLEATISQRLMLQRDLQACCEERDDLKKQLSTANFHITQLKEEASTNQNQIQILNLEVEKLNKDQQKVLMDFRTTKMNLRSLRNELKKEKKEKENVHAALQKGELSLLHLRMQFDAVVNQKDLVGGQMVRRNNEISLLREKLEVLEMACDRGKRQYSQRVEDVRLLKMEVSKLRSQLSLLKNGLSNTADMRQEVLNLQRQLAQERVECELLKRESMNPINVHRWRSLKAKEPDKFMLIEKVQVLQKRILTLHTQGIKREQSLQKSHKLYIALKEHIEKLPNYQVKEELVKKTTRIKAKDKKLKALMAELNAKDVDVKQSECLVEELKTSLKSVKLDLIREKRIKTRLTEAKKVQMEDNVSKVNSRQIFVQ